MDKKFQLSPSNERNLFAQLGEVVDIRKYLPEFAVDSEPLVYLQNPRFDASIFCYQQPYVIIGKSGFLVDYGYRLGYFASTWQGQCNPSLRFQDLKLMLQLAARRTRNSQDYNLKQKGLWDGNWNINGTNPVLVEQLTKMRGDYVRNLLS